jgi:tetratricopeptide (TPR) repeat protein
MRKAIAAGGPYPENTAWCHAELAIQFINAGAFPSAKQELELAHKLAPENPRVLIAQGRLASAKGDYKAAIAAFEKSSSITPTHDSLAPLADLYLVTGDKEKAHSQIAKVIAFHEHSHAHGENHTHPGSHQLALFLADHGNDPKAALDEALSANEHFPNIATEDALAWAYYKSGKYPEARRHLIRALAKNTPDPMLQFHAGMIYEKLGQTSDARRYLAQALNLNAGFHPIHASAARDILAGNHKP